MSGGEMTPKPQSLLSNTGDGEYLEGHYCPQCSQLMVSFGVIVLGQSFLFNNDGKH
jgi:hypothetical protein